MTGHSGLFVTFEGGEGAGKSVQAEAIRRRLQAARCFVVVTREPGGTPLGERLRSILLDLSAERLRIDPLSETLLFIAARAELVATVIRPALARGDVVVCDRFADSTRAYQGFGRGIDLTLIDKLNAAATGVLEPDLVVLLDLPPAAGLARRPPPDNDDRFGQEDIAFHERVRHGYRSRSLVGDRRFAAARNDHGRHLAAPQTGPRPAFAGLAKRTLTLP